MLHEFIVFLMDPFLSWDSRCHWLALLLFLIVLWQGRQDAFFKMWEGDSWKVDVKMLLCNQLFKSIIPLTSMGIALNVALQTASTLGPVLDTMKQFAVFHWDCPLWIWAGIYSVTLFLLSDLSRFVLHVAMHKIAFLWQFHQFHHSANRLSPLTFYRIHPIEMFLYQLRTGTVTGIVSGLFYALLGQSIEPWTIFGIVGIGWFFNLIFGNFRHSHFVMRFPYSIERWFISPAQHQIHHSADPKHYNRNFGVWLAIWDRLYQSWHPSEASIENFGLEKERPQQFWTLLYPFSTMSFFVIMGLSLPILAQAEENTDDNAEDIPTGEGSIIVYEDHRIKEAGSAQAVSEEKLALFEWNNIENIVGTVPGVSTRGEDGFGLRPNIGIRGANSDRSAKVTLMEDGILLAPAPYGAPAAYYFPMSTRLVGVEVFKGAASTRHGPQTVGGAINVLTRPIPKEKTISNDLAVGGYQSLKWHGFLGNRKGNWGYLLEGSHLQSRGFKELPNQANTGFYRSEFMSKIGYFTQSQQLQLKLGYSQEISHETYLGITQSDWQNNPYQRYSASQLGLMDWKRSQIELSWRLQPFEQVAIHSTVYHHYLDRSWQKINGFMGDVDLHELLIRNPQYGKGADYLAVLRGIQNSTDEDLQIRLGQNDRNYHSFGMQSIGKWSISYENWQNDLELGLRFHGDQIQRNHTETPAIMQDSLLIVDEKITNTIHQNHVRMLGYSMYVFDNVSIQKWHIIPSTRLELMQGWKEIAEEYNTFRNIILPGISGLYEISDWTDAFIGIYKGFSPVAPEADADVQPEMSWNTEVGIRQQSDQLSVEGVLFWNDYQNITGACTLSSGCDIQNLGQQYNGGQAIIRGFEGMLNWEIWLPNGWKLPLDMTYTWTDGQFQDDFQSEFSQFGTVYAGDRLPYVAIHQGSLGFRLLEENWQIGSNIQYRSSMLDEAGHFGDVQEILPLMTADLSGERKLNEHWSGYFNINNVTNQQNIVSWRPFGARPLAPRWVMIGVEWQ